MHGNPQEKGEILFSQTLVTTGHATEQMVRWAVVLLLPSSGTLLGKE